MSVAREDITFLNPTIKNIEFFINEDFNQELFSAFDNLNLSNKISYDENFDSENDKKVQLTLFLKMGEKSSKYPFYLNIGVSSIFSFNKNFNREDSEKFLNINGSAVLFSYIRTHISYLTNMSEYPPFTLPFYDFTDSKAIRTDEDSLEK